MAEIAIGAMSRQWVDRRMSDQSTPRREIEAWQDRRNRDAMRANWRFTTADARIKMHSRYPSIRRNYQLGGENVGISTHAECSPPSMLPSDHQARWSALFDTVY